MAVTNKHRILIKTLLKCPLARARRILNYRSNTELDQRNINVPST
jgi:hypothetical protein